MTTDPLTLASVAFCAVRLVVDLRAAWVSGQMLRLVGEDRKFLMASGLNGVRALILDGQDRQYQRLRAASLGLARVPC